MIVRIWTLSCFLGSVGLSLLAGEKTVTYEKDRKAILEMAGSFTVGFHFEETVGYPIGYQVKEPYDSAAMEIVEVVENEPGRIVLQHVLQTKRGIIKHWRQDWLYENRELWEYRGHNTWTKREINAEEARGTWTQRVFQVDDSPRYEATGRWLHIGALSQWESDSTQRPLPRREASKRDDYHILVARNRHALTQTGWVHEQDNYKLRLNDEGHPETVIAREFGLNTYDRVLDSKLAGSRDWWVEHGAFWQDVRAVWADIFKERSHLKLAEKRDDKRLYAHIFELDEAMAGKRGYRSDVAKTRIREAIEAFIVEEPGSHKQAAVKNGF